MSIPLTLSVIVLLAATGCRSVPEGVPVASMVLSGGPIHTLDERQPDVEALAIRGDRILAAGDLRAMERFLGPETLRIDLEGRAAYPGFVDAHAHLGSLGRKLKSLDVTGTSSYPEICDRVAREAARTDRGRWITGRGWDQNDWEPRTFPNHGPLTAVSPDHPVALTRIDGHATLANRLAMELARVTKETEDPPGGKIHRDPVTGEPTGVFVDAATELITAHIPRPTRSERKEEIELAIRECHRHGLVGIHDAGIDEETLAAYLELIDEGGLSFRVYAMVSADSPLLEEALRSGPRVGLGNHQLTLRSVKLYADGALGSRGAALLSSYSDDPGNTGLVLTPRDELYQITRNALEAGFQVCTHAIGDRGNRMVLDVYEQALRDVPSEDPRLRIEHAQVISPEDIPRFGRLGVIPSMQPTHCTSDMDWVPERIGPKRSEGAYAWRSLIDDGNRIPCGSDFPVEEVDPLLGVHAAATRQHRDGFPTGGWFPDQRMSLEEVVRGFTVDAAYASFDEELRGRLTGGSLADVTIFTRDILAGPPEAVLEAKAWMTIVGGEIVYRAESR